jgi:hypothetical protein
MLMNEKEARISFLDHFNGLGDPRIERCKLHPMAEILLLVLCGVIASCDGWDNAVAESFFHSLKVELTHHENFKTREEAKKSIFEYTRCFIIESECNYLLPVEYERLGKTA